MKKSCAIKFLFFFLIAACHSPQAETKQADSSQSHGTDQASKEQQIIQTLSKTGDLVKAESPDALTKFEQGYAMPGRSGGISQSPVDIITADLKNHPGLKADLKFTGSIRDVDNLGHTIQVDFSIGSITRFNGKSYELKQLHFHTPSEHLIDGITFPMEMHVVSKLNDSIKAQGSTYLVLGILFRFGHENKFLKEFLDSIPQEEGKDSLDQRKVRLADLLVEMSRKEKPSYYNYQGSLTTPPFTESVNWLVSTRIFEASEKQIATIGKLEGNNARHVRALNNRKIELEK